jgi:hypothetical protein
MPRAIVERRVPRETEGKRAFGLQHPRRRRVTQVASRRWRGTPQPARSGSFEDLAAKECRRRLGHDLEGDHVVKLSPVLVYGDPASRVTASRQTLGNARLPEVRRACGEEAPRRADVDRSCCVNHGIARRPGREDCPTCCALLRQVVNPDRGDAGASRRILTGGGPEWRTDDGSPVIAGLRRPEISFWWRAFERARFVLFGGHDLETSHVNTPRGTQRGSGRSAIGAGCHAALVA